MEFYKNGIPVPEANAYTIKIKINGNVLVDVINNGMLQESHGSYINNILELENSNSNPNTNEEYIEPIDAEFIDEEGGVKLVHRNNIMYFYIDYQYNGKDYNNVKYDGCATYLDSNLFLEGMKGVSSEFMSIYNSMENKSINELVDILINNNEKEQIEYDFDMSIDEFSNALLESFEEEHDLLAEWAACSLYCHTKKIWYAPTMISFMPHETVYFDNTKYPNTKIIVINTSVAYLVYVVGKSVKRFSYGNWSDIIEYCETVI